MNLKVLKLITVITFLLTFGIQENGVPNFILLIIFFGTFLNDLFNNSSSIFWQGLMVIPTVGLLILFLRSKNYKILTSCFVILLFILFYITGVFHYCDRIHEGFIIPATMFLISSIYAIILTRKGES